MFNPNQDGTPERSHRDSRASVIKLGFVVYGDVFLFDSKKMLKPGVTKECFLEALEYLKTSKKHPFETPGRV